MPTHKVPIARLRPNPKNPRRITGARLKMLKASMARFGDMSGVVLNIRTGELVSGHQRTEVVRKHLKDVVITDTFEPATAAGTVRQGYLDLDGERFSYREVDLSEADASAAALASNQAAGAWELPLLQDALHELDALNFDLDLTMFDAAQRDAILGGAPGDVDEREAPLEPSFKVVVQCRDEVHQGEVLMRLQDEGLVVKASGG